MDTPRCGDAVETKRRGLRPRIVPSLALKSLLTALRATTPPMLCPTKLIVANAARSLSRAWASMRFVSSGVASLGRGVWWVVRGVVGSRVWHFFGKARQTEDARTAPRAP